MKSCMCACVWMSVAVYGCVNVWMSMMCACIPHRYVRGCMCICIPHTHSYLYPSIHPFMHLGMRCIGIPYRRSNNVAFPVSQSIHPSPWTSLSPNISHLEESSCVLAFSSCAFCSSFPPCSSSPCRLSPSPQRPYNCSPLPSKRKYFQ